MRIFLPIDLIKNLKSRVSTDASREALCGMWVDVDASKVFVSDGHRMALREYTAVEDAFMPPYDQIVDNLPDGSKSNVALIPNVNPRDGLLKMLRQIDKQDKVWLTISNKGVRISTDNAQMFFDCVTECPIKEHHVIVCVKYLVDAFTALVKKPVKLRTYSRLEPISISAGEDIEIVMPTCK